MIERDPYNTHIQSVVNNLFGHCVIQQEKL